MGSFDLSFAKRDGGNKWSGADWIADEFIGIGIAQTTLEADQEDDDE